MDTPRPVDFSELFGIIEPETEEVQLPRTANFGNMMDPNWSSDLDKFELGKWNTTYGSTMNLSKIMDMMERQQELISSILDQVVKLLAKGK